MILNLDYWSIDHPPAIYLSRLKLVICEYLECLATSLEINVDIDHIRFIADIDHDVKLKYSLVLLYSFLYSNLVADEIV